MSEHYQLFIAEPCMHLDLVYLRIDDHGARLYDYEWKCWVCGKKVRAMADIPKGQTIEEWVRKLPEPYLSKLAKDIPPGARPHP